MITLEVNDAAVVQQKALLEQLLTTNPNTEKALQKLIRKAIKEARAETASKIKFKNGDPHHAAQSIRTTVYKKILGANINIYNSRRAHGSIDYTPPRKQRPPHARGGNRRKRSAETQRILSYGPLDRGFILRFVNSGTGDRNTRYGARGSIAARNFLRSAGEPALVKAVDTLSNLIDSELQNILNKKK
ncbi:MAG: hypothetical protein U0L04_10880 [Bacteroidaceae bacterium]|nr:hypothetical protein [Bacteroidaceae bacterium]